MDREPETLDLQALIATCLELQEREGAGAVDALLAEHPALAPAARERLDMLGRLGLVAQPAADDLPERVGPYPILGVLGQGGMGVVYEAQQEKPRRRVALKVLRLSPGEGARARLQQEAELLARLQHPGIAHVYDVGTAAVGGVTVPYFAMELVRGEPVDRHAEARGLGVDERLELVERICDAVHHAHQNGVIHRDLKPGNILVDETGRPRILDFGIARAVDPDLHLESLRTEVGQLLGTLAYMSPEQASGNPAEVDTRTDVYALGAVAYELLSGRLPRDVDGMAVLPALQVIRAGEVPRLSARRPGIARDVETIVSKALESDKERRYASAHELAADIRRFLDDEPISARPATASYQLVKFARRHRAVFAGALALVLALALGLAGTLVGLRRAAEQRDDAERRFRLAQTVRDFQGRMFAAADPLGQGIRVEDLLDRAALLIEDESSGPLDEAALSLQLGEAYEGLGQYDKAAPLVAKAAEIYERELGLADLSALEARTRLAALYSVRLARLDDAERALDGLDGPDGLAAREHGEGHDVTLFAALVRAALEFERGRYGEARDIARSALGRVEPDSPRWGEAQRRLARSLQALGDVDEAIEVGRTVHRRTTQRYGDDHPATWHAMDILGNMLMNEGRLLEGLEIVEELWALRKKHLGPDHPDTLSAQVNVGLACVNRGDGERAVEVLGDALTRIRAHYPRDHPQHLVTLHNLANAFLLLERPTEAEPLAREAFTLTEARRGPEHIDSRRAKGALAWTLLQLRQFDEAEQLYLELLDLQRRMAGDDDGETLKVVFNVAQFYHLTGRHAEAEPLHAEAVEIGRRILPADSYELGIYLRGQGVNWMKLQRYEESEMALMESRDWLERTLPDALEHPRYTDLLRQFERLYQLWGRPEDAASYTTQLEGAE